MTTTTLCHWSDTLLFLLLINSITTGVTNEQKTLVTITDPNTPNEPIKTFTQEIKITLEEKYLGIEKDDNGEIYMNITNTHSMRLTMNIVDEISEKIENEYNHFAEKVKDKNLPNEKNFSPLVLSMRPNYNIKSIKFEQLNYRKLLKKNENIYELSIPIPMKAFLNGNSTSTITGTNATMNFKIIFEINENTINPLETNSSQKLLNFVVKSIKFYGAYRFIFASRQKDQKELAFNLNFPESSTENGLIAQKTQLLIKPSPPSNKSEPESGKTSNKKDGNNLILNGIKPVIEPLDTGKKTNLPSGITSDKKDIVNGENKIKNLKPKTTPNVEEDTNQLIKGVNSGRNLSTKQIILLVSIVMFVIVCILFGLCLWRSPKLDPKSDNMAIAHGEDDVLILIE